MKCNFCNAPMAAVNPKRGWKCSDCCYLHDLAYRERRKAQGIKTSGSKVWDPAKRAAWYAANKEALNTKAAERMRRYTKDPELRQRHEARWKVHRALESGRLIRRPCRCGATRTHAHHHDYAKPLEVEWLCPTCHRAEHAKARGTP